MQYIKDFFFRRRCKKLFNSNNDTTEKLNFLLHCRDITELIDFRKIKAPTLLTYVVNFEELLELIVQCNADVRLGRVNKAIPIVEKETKTVVSFFTDTSVDLIPFNREHCNELFISEVNKYIKAMEKLKDNETEVAFYTRRHTQVIEDIVALLKLNL